MFHLCKILVSSLYFLSNPSRLSIYNERNESRQNSGNNLHQLTLKSLEIFDAEAEKYMVSSSEKIISFFVILLMKGDINVDTADDNKDGNQTMVMVEC